MELWLIFNAHILKQLIVLNYYKLYLAQAGADIGELHTHDFPCLPL